MIHFMIKLAVRRAYIDRFASYSWTKSHKLCTITPLSCFYCSGICTFFIFVLFFRYQVQVDSVVFSVS